MNISGNWAELKFAPRFSGTHGIEVDVLANSVDGNIIDRAAFLTFDAQPTSTETSQNRVIAIGLVDILLALVFGLIGVRRRRRALKGDPAN